MNITDFIVKAKKKGYAGNGEYKKLEDGSKEFRYKKDEFEYTDRYSGSSNFIGQELVHRDGKIIWGMNYYGYLNPFSLYPFNSDVETTEEDVYEFLKECLRNIPSDKPFRGPEEFESGNLKYINKIGEKNIGELEFTGEEEIFLKSRGKTPMPVYRLFYHGGYIKPKGGLTPAEKKAVEEQKYHGREGFDVFGLSQLNNATRKRL